MVDPEKYFIPASSKWPIIAAVGLFILAIGAATCFHRDPYGPYILSVGIFVLIYMMSGWFGAVIDESSNGYYNIQIYNTFRWAMLWFIFSEIIFRCVDSGLCI